MRTADLPNWLAANRVRPDAYDLSGGSANEAYVLRPCASGGWEVFYSERGQRTGYIVFQQESAACRHFSGLIEADTTTRAGDRPPANA